MHVIRARNVCDALVAGTLHLLRQGEWGDSRAGRVIVAPCPVVTEYHSPTERVLTSSVRDANPFFHLGEALWMLAGRQDATWLDRFVRDYSSRFGEPITGHQHGAYGYRWRRWFGDEEPTDQLATIARLLRDNPLDRRTVLTMWDPAGDLGEDHRDIPCNTHAYFRVLGGALHMTVCCRSNDIIWGCYGANAVHFGFLLEYMAAMVGVQVGTYTQVSNNFHAYEDTLTRLLTRCPVSGPGRQVDLSILPPSMIDDRYRKRSGGGPPLVTDPTTFDEELGVLVNLEPGELRDEGRFGNQFLEHVARRVLLANHMWREAKDPEAALRVLMHLPAVDWREACCEWIRRRVR